ncbi:MAG: hypothetical protein ACLR9J_03180 [Eubacterium sp.]
MPLLEITNGVCGGDFPAAYRRFLSFGGICIHLQISQSLRK